jgi:hypothetical protein
MSTKTNRRISNRKPVVCPVHLDSAERKERLGITRNVSRSGSLLLTSSHFAVGDRLQVTFYVSKDPKRARKVVGEVVRVDPLEPGLQWRFALALRFEKDLPDAEAVFAEIVD